MENADLPLLASPFLSLPLSPPRTRLHRVSPLARASRNFNEASCGSQIREIVSRPARRATIFPHGTTPRGVVYAHNSSPISHYHITRRSREPPLPIGERKRETSAERCGEGGRGRRRRVKRKEKKRWIKGTTRRVRVLLIG